MPRFAANLTLLWPDLEPLARFAAAAQAGFSHAEILFVHPLDPAAVETALRETGLALVLFDPRPGDWAKGERGLLCLPGREAEFLESLHEALAAAARFKTRKLNALAGLLPAGVSRDEAFAVAVSNLRAAAPLAQAMGVTLLVENINRVDMPGYFAGTVAEAVALVEAVGSPAVRLQLDQYHCGMSGEDARAALARHAHLVGHVQVADVPGRHQPGTGTQPIGRFLADLDAMSYAGYVGLEYKPLGGMEAALAWLPRAARSSRD